MKKIFFITGFLLLNNMCFAQQSTIDSLNVLIEQSEEDSTKVKLMLNLSKLYFVSDPNKAISISEQAKALSESINYKSGVAYSLKNIGLGYYYMSDYVMAISYWQQAKFIFEEINDVVGVSNMLNNMGAIYSDQGDHVKALELMLTSLKLAEKVKDTFRIATALQNISIMHEDNHDYELALSASTRALPLFESTDDVDGIGLTLLGIARIYKGLGNYDSALIYIQKSLKFLKPSNYFYSDVLLLLGSVYIKKDDYESGFKYLNLSYNVALGTGSSKTLAMSLTELAFAHEENGDLELAIELYEKSIPSALEVSNSNAELLNAYSALERLYLIQGNRIKVLEYKNLVQNVKDSIYNIESAKAQNRLVFNYEIEKKEREIALLNKENELQKAKEEKQKLIRNGFVYAFLLVLVFASVFLIQRNKIKKGKKLSDELLHNILPDEVAEELKEKGESVAKDFEDVSVLFSDFEGFTNISENLTPKELVAELNTCFKAFDSIITSYGMEKIKTIGDSYMAAGGLHIPRTSTTKDVVLAGLEMQDFVRARKNDLESKHKPFFEMRLGIHTGHVVAGIVGAKKFQYDIWGDTVNIASRMESSGEVGKVNISEDTYQLVKNEKLIFELRGKIEAKNKGELTMYFVKKASEK